MIKFNYKACLILFAVICGVFFLFSGFGLQKENNKGVNQTVKPKPLSQKVESIRKSGRVFEEKRIVNVNSSAQQRTLLNTYLNSFTSLRLDKTKLQNLLNKKNENISFVIPINSSETMELELYKVNILTDDYKTGSLSGSGAVTYTDYTPGVYYRGIIKGDNESFASLSVFDDFVMAVASNKDGNWNLSSIKDESRMYTDNYVFYNDKDLIRKNNFNCGVTDDQNSVFDKRHDSWQRTPQNDNMPPQLIRKYFECDNKMYQDFGSNTTNVNNYVTAFFNSCATMYQQDSVNTAIQQIFVWTTPDIYIGLTENTRILTRFGARNQNSFNGDLAHWISTRTDISGGVAWVGVLCEPFNPTDSSGRYAVSIIDSTFMPFPQYSWTVNVVVHEMGHNLGSNHTHNCSWPGGPIDSCYTIEGGCYGGPRIARVGTVMSYCHLNASINLALGFGHYPADTIRAHIRRASCLPIGIEPISSEIPKSFSLSQNYPNPFNPSTKIKFEIPGSSVAQTFLSVYDLLGREVATLVNEQLKPGTYEVDFDGSKLASGVYFYKLIVEDFTATKKMILIK